MTAEVSFAAAVRAHIHTRQGRSNNCVIMLSVYSLFSSWVGEPRLTWFPQNVGYAGHHCSQALPSPWGRQGDPIHILGPGWEAIMATAVI